MKPFDLERAKAGDPICTRDGHDARIICNDLKNEDFTFVALVLWDDGSEHPLMYNNEGECSNMDDQDDLFMKSRIHKGYCSVVRNCSNGDMYVSSKICKTYDDARVPIDSQNFVYVGVTQMEWEE